MGVNSVDSGWIKLHRKLLDNEIWHDPLALRLFILLLLRAAHEDTKVNGIEIKRGQWLRSYSNLSEDLGYKVGRGMKLIPKTTLFHTISKLKKHGMVAVDETKHGTLFTVVNYEQYQGFSGSDEIERGTVDGTNLERTWNERGTKTIIKETERNNKDTNILTDISIVDTPSETESEPEPKPKFGDDHEATILTRLLAKLMLQNNPNARIPKAEKDAQKWIAEMERIHRLDGYSYDEIKQAIIWCQNDEFWKSNILSTKKLREKMPTLVLQMKRRGNQPQGRPQSRYERTVSVLDRLYREADEIEQEGNRQTH
jgi:hypothetical protein